MIKKIVIGLAAGLVVIQFFQPEKNQAAELSPNDIAHVYSDMPTDIKTLLQNKCYDCHSNNTKYPWYAHTQPVAWWIANHVKEGKQELNFSEFALYDHTLPHHNEVLACFQKGQKRLSYSDTFIQVNILCGL